MRARLGFLVAFAVLGTVGCYHRVQYAQRFAGAVPLRVSNQCAYAIQGIYIRPASTLAWGTDWTRGAAIPPGTYVDIGLQPGLYDVRVTTATHAVLTEAHGLDMRGAQALFVRLPAGPSTPVMMTPQ